MYDYETIKKNFEKIKPKEILTYKQMCEKIGDIPSTNGARRKHQFEDWKRYIDWKSVGRGNFTKIKMFSEEEVVENIFEKMYD